jgi:hypothetical protein
MTAIVLSRIFTIGIGDTPTLAFEAQNLREAQELCHEQWLKDDLAEAKSDGAPLWDGKAKLRARMALPDESALFTEAKSNGQGSGPCIFCSSMSPEPRRARIRRPADIW